MPTGKKPQYGWERPNTRHWWYRFRIDGRPFVGSTDCEDAKAAAAVIEQKRVEAREIMRREREGLGVIRFGRKQISLEQALHQFETDKGPGWKTLRMKKLYADYLLNLADGGKTLVSEITEADFIKYRQRRRLCLTRAKTPVKDSTINREIAHMQACINYVGIVLKYDIPIINWKVCFIKNAEREQQWVLSPSQETKLFEEVRKERPDLVPLVQFAIWAACRKSQAVNLRWDHVFLEDKVCIIYKKCKGEATQHVVALTDRMIELIDAQPRVEGCDQVFTYECKETMRDRKGGVKVKGQRYRFSEAGWTKVWNRAKKAAGLDGFRFHDLRHTGATRLTRSTGDIQLTKEQCGHADIKTTLRYSKVDVNDLRAAQEKAQRTVPKAV